MPYPWPWLDEEHVGLRDSLRDGEAFFSTEAVQAVKVLSKDHAQDFVPDAPGHWWRALCRASLYQGNLLCRNGSTIPYRTHRAPDVDCTCGFYAFKEAEMSLSDRAWGDRERRVGNLDGLATGLWRVELAGLVIEHERGYRAERLRLISRIEPRDPLEVLHELGQGTTGQIRRACGFDSDWESAYVRSVLKAAARRGECIEVKTPQPNNHGGHLWVSTQ